MKKFITTVLVLGLLSMAKAQFNSLENSLYRTIPMPIQQTHLYLKHNPFQQDVLYLFDLIQQAYPKLETKINKKDLLQYRDRLIAQFAMDTNIVHLEMEVQKVLAALKDAHCGTSLENINKAIQKENLQFPFTVWVDNNKLYLRSIDRSQDSSLLYSEILTIGKADVQTIQQKAKLVEKTESMEGSLVHFCSGKINSPTWLRLLNMHQAENGLTLRLRKPNGLIDSIRIMAQPPKSIKWYVTAKKQMATARAAKGFYYEINKAQNLAYFQINTMLDYEAIKDGIAQYVSKEMLPMALQYMQKKHSDAGTLSFNAFILDAMQAVNASGIRHIVLDLRYNSGGDMRIPKQFLYLLAKAQQVRPFQTYSKYSDYFTKAMSNDYKKDSIEYVQKFNRQLPVKGQLLNMDSLLGRPEYEDFYSEVKQPGTPFYIPDTVKKFTGDLYVLTGFSTGSAAMITATTIADNQLGLVVGLPTGNQPTNATGASNNKLPNSGINFGLSYTFMQRPMVAKNSDLYLVPDVLVRRNIEKMNNGIDEQMEWIVEAIKKK
jgi:C-terminal processing protease CtpA/Prc